MNRPPQLLDAASTFTEEEIVLTSDLLEPCSQPLGAMPGKETLDPKLGLSK